MSAGAEELTEAVDFAIVKWRDLRQRHASRAADAYFRNWLFETIPAEVERALCQALVGTAHLCGHST